MMISKTSISLLLAILTMSAGIAGTAPAVRADDQAYLDYLAKFKSGTALAEVRAKGEDPTVLGRHLRFLYAKTSFYQPYLDPSQQHSNEAAEHRAAGRFESCLKAAEDALEINYTSLVAHFLAGRCSASLDDEARTKKLMLPYVLLLESIITDPGRDGLTPDTSYRVISISEQYVVLGHLGFKRQLKTLVADKSGQMNDCHHRTEDDPRQPRTICFNVDVPMSVLSKELRKP
jgi:hypothetical protein